LAALRAKVGVVLASEKAMRRRDFIAGIAGSAAAWPVATRAQPTERVRRVIVLFGVPQADPETKRRADVLIQGLRELGWIEGRNIRFDYRYSTDAESSRTIAAESADLTPDLILAHGNPFVAALRSVKAVIPIVFAGVSDPVGSGFVESLARPGGNITGFTNFETEIGGKWVEVLKEIAPNVRRVLFLHHAQTAANVAFLHAGEAAAPIVGVTVMPADVRNSADIERAVTEFSGQPDGGLIIAAHVVLGNNIDLLGTLATRHHLPSIYPFRQWMVRNEGLVSYGIDVFDQFRRAAAYVDRILRGTKAADLPIQNPTKYELVINLKTAKTLGLTVSLPLLGRADEVIE
jgi:putative ABC transport system substrate-binding protein